MEHFFELEVDFEGTPMTFSARLVTFGYSYKFYLIVDKTELQFEKDDNGQYRILSEGGQADIPAGLLQAIITALEDIQQ